MLQKHRGIQYKKYTIKSTTRFFVVTASQIVIPTLSFATEVAKWVAKMSLFLQPLQLTRDHGVRVVTKFAVISRCAWHNRHTCSNTTDIQNMARDRCGGKVEQAEDIVDSLQPVLLFSGISDNDGDVDDG